MMETRMRTRALLCGLALAGLFCFNDFSYAGGPATGTDVAAKEYNIAVAQARLNAAIDKLGAAKFALSMANAELEGATIAVNALDVEIKQCADELRGILYVMKINEKENDQTEVGDLLSALAVMAGNLALPVRAATLRDKLILLTSPSELPSRMARLAKAQAEVAIAQAAFDAAQSAVADAEAALADAKSQ